MEAFYFVWCLCKLTDTLSKLFPFFEHGSPFMNEFASVLRKMEYWTVVILAVERRLRSPVTKSEGWITLVSLERLHLLPPFPRLFVLSRTTYSSVNWQMDTVDTDFLICWVFKPKVSSTAFFSQSSLIELVFNMVKRTNFQLRLLWLGILAQKLHLCVWCLRNYLIFQYIGLQFCK